MSALKRIPWDFYGTWAIVLSMVMAVTSASLLYYAYPVFFPVIVKEFAWPATIAATAASLKSFGGGIEAPAVGWVMDKYGPRVVTIVGSIGAGLGLIALTQISDILQYYIVYGVIVTIGTNACMYTPQYKLLSNWWVKRRGMAIGMMVLPTALGGTLAPILAAWGITNFGWRPTIAAIGLLTIAIMVPCGILTRPHRPEYYGLLPDGDDPRKVTVADEAAKKAAEAALAQETMKKEVDLTLKEAVKSSSFWTYGIGNIFMTVGTSGVIPFLPALLMSRGFDVTTAAFFAGIMMTVSYTGRFAVLFFADAMGPKLMWVAQCFLLAAGTFCAAMATPDTSYFAWGYALLFGVGYGANIPLQAVVRGWLFGRTAFATIGGIIATVGMVGSVSAPVGAGFAMDTTGTYAPAYFAFSASLFLAGVIFISLRRPKPKETLQPTVAAAQV